MNKQIKLENHLSTISIICKAFTKRWSYIKRVWEYSDLFNESILIFYEAKGKFKLNPDSEKTIEQQFSSYFNRYLKLELLQRTFNSRCPMEVHPDINFDEVFTSSVLQKPIFVEHIPATVPSRKKFYQNINQKTKQLLDCIFDEMPEGFIMFIEDMHKKTRHDKLLPAFFGITSNEIDFVKKEFDECMINL